VQNQGEKGKKRREHESILKISVGQALAEVFLRNKTGGLGEKRKKKKEPDQRHTLREKRPQSKRQQKGAKSSENWRKEGQEEK